MKVISLGWGIQSFTLAAMSAIDEADPVDVALHSDTHYERTATYAFAEKWTPWLEMHGVHVVTVGKNGNTIINKSGMTTIPARTSSAKGGLMRRMCTQNWKIEPMRKLLHETRQRQSVEFWLGITTDDAERMKPSDVKYLTHRWPLIERRMSRNDCIAWLTRHDLEVPVKSSCVFCPYHSRSAWHQMKREGGEDWRQAVRTDEEIRKARPPFDLYLHYDLIPLADIRTPQDNGQMELWSEECSGFCFV